MRVRPSINVISALAGKGIRVVTQESPQAVFAGITRFTEGFKALLNRAHGLAFEVASGVRLGPDDLSQVLRRGIELAEQMDRDLISLRLELGPSGVEVSPQTWSGQNAARLALQSFQATTHALFEMDRVFAQENLLPEEAEMGAAGIIFRYFKPRAIKAYDVAADGSVRLSHLYSLQEDILVKTNRHEGLSSHFIDWVPPERYAGEAMFEVIDKGTPFILVRAPGEDKRCCKSIGNERVQFESKPFALIGERNASGQVTRVYKVDWETPEELLTYSELAFKGCFARLENIKQKLALETEAQTTDEIYTVAANEPDVDKALGITSTRIAELFEVDGRGILADRVTIMLYDPSADLLATRVVWAKGVIQQPLYFTGKGDRGIARRLFDRGQTEPLYLGTLSEWREEGTQWQQDGKGSLISAVLSVGKNKSGIIMVSSMAENAFTQDQVRVLGEVSRRVGPAFERIVKGMETANLHQKFGPPFGLKIYNAPYLSARLAAGIQLAKRESGPLSVIFMDIDHFKPTNEAWGNHGEVDQLLAAIFRSMLAELRDGEFYLVGGEEFVVRMNAPLREAVAVAKRLRAAVDRPITVKIPYDTRLAAAAAMAQIQTRLESNNSKYANSGIKEVEVAHGRNGEWLLVVTAHKTISVGVSAFRSDDNAKTLLDRAEACQVTAKNSGRNNVVVQSD